MGSLTPFVLLALIWILIHLRRRQLAAHAVLLPTTTFSSEPSSPLYKLGRRTTVSLSSPVTLRVETTVLSSAHSRLLTVISKRNSRLGGVVRRFYGCASLAAVLGQLFGICILLWSLYHLGVRVMSGGGPRGAPPSGLTRRDASSSTSGGYVLQPLIPGVTLPLAHLPHVLAALIACTAIHELGHAVAAAADGVPLLSWGYSLLIAVPIAFVALSDTFPAPPPRTRLRIAGAGAYHNLLTLLLLQLFATAGPLWPWLGYNSATTGVVVVDVLEDSPLYPHLPTGSFVTQLDDTPLAGPSPPAAWTEVLLGEPKHQSGWCVDADWFEAQPQACCAGAAAGACFTTHPAPALVPGGHCLDAPALFENRTRHRCGARTDCGAHACVAPHATAALLRVYLAGDDARVVVWQGPRREVWEHVSVSPYVPRTRLLPASLPHTGALLLEYTRAVSLSLFVLNLLPVRALDGGAVLRALLDARGDADLEAGGVVWVRRAGRVQRAVEVGTLALVGVVLVGGVVV